MPRIPAGPCFAVLFISCLLDSMPAHAVPQGRGLPEPTYRNVEILTGVGPAQFARIMEAMTVSLGVTCEYCHDPVDRAGDVRPAKDAARRMMRMITSASTEFFGALEAPSCWTCHRGAPIPESRPPETPVGVETGGGGAAFSSEDRPSGEVYRNVQLYADLPASDLGAVMTSYTRALGVDCEHCHVGGDWASDEVLMKRVSRRMFEIQQALDDRYLGGEGTLTCWSCHRGETLPETALPVELLPD